MFVGYILTFLINILFVNIFCIEHEDINNAFDTSRKFTH